MQSLDGTLHLSATDLANHLACRHLTFLDLEVALGRRCRPRRHDPELVALEQRGLEHENRYLDALRAQGLTVERMPDGRPEDHAALTLEAMRRGMHVIVQAALADGRWRGVADVLLRVDSPSSLGPWSYEVVDTKLAKETRGGTLVQLCVYAEMLAALQGRRPDEVHVITPGEPFVHERYRVADVDAYFRFVRARLETAIDEQDDGGYPEPREHCDVCRWWSTCDDRRRADDHLSLVAGISRLQTRELQARAIVTVDALAREPLPLSWAPARGSREGLVRVREQARVQVEGRVTGNAVYELLEVEPDRGLARLPAPSAGDVFLDLEGDPFAGPSGQEYLFGDVVLEAGTAHYRGRWALGAAAERRAFEDVIDMIVERAARFPDMHVYHFAPYESSAFRRLMGRYATREAEMDDLLRSGRFIDLHAVLCQGVRAGVERYSLKDLERFYTFTRQVDLRTASAARQAVEQAIELGRADGIAEATRAAVERYNEDDCRSTLALRDWLEARRAELIASGTEVPRPLPKQAEPTPEVTERLARIRALSSRLVEGLPEAPEERTPAQQAQWLLAQVLEFHRREDKASWWEYYRLCDLAEDELYDERAALSGLRFDEVRGTVKRSEVHRYSFPAQESQIRPKAALKTQDRKAFGNVVAIDPIAGWVDVLKGPSIRDMHPTAVFEHSHVDKSVIVDALVRLAESVAAHGIDAEPTYPVARRLLLREPPRRAPGVPGVPGVPLQRVGEKPLEAARRLALTLDGDVLAIQGPPGCGKTYTGGEIVAALVAAGRRVGVTALSHKVIRNQLDAIIEACQRHRVGVQCMQRVPEDWMHIECPIVEATDNADVQAALASGESQVIGGTSWLWAREDMRHAVDVLIVDEAAQMSLADVLAASQGARNLVLLGDPRQLDQPTQGSHPDGTAVSALQHLLGHEQTMPAERGLFLAVTWRLSPEICAFTSDVFYDRRLEPLAGLERQRLVNAEPFDGAGLWLVPVGHEGNQNSSPEEVARVRELVTDLLDHTSWIDRNGAQARLTLDDILIVSPYNAHVFALINALPAGARVGTVDKFQGQQAPVVIYTLATSAPEDAPRGMEFLYSPNRLNVATSRARCTCILVANPRLFEPECRTPEQITLANAFCRYRELARSC